LDTVRAATSGEVTDLRREARALEEIVAEQALELRRHRFAESC
jgi:transposase